MSTSLIQTKEFVTYKSPLDSFEVANERFLGIIEPGLIRGFDTLYVNSALSFNLLHQSGIEKTTKAGDSTTARTGILYTHQGTILHFSDDFGLVSITRDSEQSSSDLYWAVGVLHKYVSEEGINPIVLKVSEPSVSEAAAISDMNSDDPYNTILIGVLSFKPNGTPKDIDLQTNRTLFTWEPKPSGDIAGHKNASKSEVDLDTIVRTLNDQTINGEKSFSGLKGISEANPLVKIPITNNIQNRVFSDITTNNYTAIFKINNVEFITDDAGEFLNTKRTVRVWINIIDPKPIPINYTYLLEISAEPQTVPTYVTYLINSSGKERVNDCLKLYYDSANNVRYIVYYHGSLSVYRTATITYVISDPHTRGFHPVDNNTILNTGPNITTTALYPSGSEELLKYSEIGINAKSSRITISNLEANSGTNKYKYINLGRVGGEAGSYVRYHISGSFINSNTTQEQFSIIAEFRWKDYTTTQTTDMLSCNILNSFYVLGEVNNPLACLAKNIFFVWDATSNELLMSVVDSDLGKPFNYRSLSYYTIKAYFNIAILDASNDVIQRYNTGLSSLPNTYSSRQAYGSWLDFPRMVVGVNYPLKTTPDPIYLADQILGTAFTEIIFLDSNHNIKYGSNVSELSQTDYIKSARITYTDNGTIYSLLNGLINNGVPRKYISLYIGRSEDHTPIQFGTSAKTTITSPVKCEAWDIRNPTAGEYYLVLYVNFPGLVAYDTNRYISILYAIECDTNQL